MKNPIVVPLIFLFGGVLLAQQDMGVITGLVTDQSGAVVVGARVTVTDTQTNETRSSTTLDSGAYTVGPLRIGTYNVTVERTGFTKEVWKGIIVHAQDRARVDFKLNLGQVAETISVTGEAPILESESATLSHVVSETEVRQLPLNGRNFQQLAWLSAGVYASTQGRDSTSGFNANGQQVGQNDFIMDGIDNNNNVMGMQDRKAQVIIPSLDAVSEFKVMTSNYSAEFGRNSGAVMIVSLKSGGNEFHGTAFEYLRNDYFDSRNTFSPGTTKLRQNQYGGTIGGPMIRNRTFFFASFERFQQSNGLTLTGTVPTDAEKQGIFPMSLVTIKDPVTKAPFPNNAVPASRFDPTAAKLLPLWPEPNYVGPGRSNYVSNPASTLWRNTIDTRIDHSFTDRDKIFGRFSHQILNSDINSIFPEPARGALGNTYSVNTNPAYSVAFSYTHIFGPTLVNEFRYGFVRQLVNLHELTDTPLSSLTAKYGINGIPGNSSLFGLPEFDFTGSGLGFTGLGETGSIPNFKIHQVHQYLDNLTWNHGNHSFKFGTDLHWQRSDILGGNNSHGVIGFNGTYTGISLGDFLVGMPSSATLSTQLVGEMRFRNYMFFAEDAWKMTPKLTLNMGLRYEFTTPWWEKHNHMDTLVLDPGPNFGAIQAAGYCGGSLSCKGLTQLNWLNFAPRLGIAYQLDKKTVIRAAAGTFYGGQGALGASGREINNWPYSYTVTLTGTNATPALVLNQGFPAGITIVSGTPPANSNWTVWATHFPEPKVFQWNFTVERELARGLALTAAYVGSASSYLSGNYNWNGAPPGPPATLTARRPIPQWNTIMLYSPFGHSSYNGLNVQLEKRYSAGLIVSAAYTWSHSLDNIAELNGGAAGELQQTTDFNSSRASSGFDIRQRFVASAAYELPFGKGKPFMNRGGILNALFGGWQLTNILTFQGGAPFSVTVSGAAQTLGASDLTDWRAESVGDWHVSNPNQNQWFNPKAFAIPQINGVYVFGNSGRNILRGDGIGNMDAGLIKIFAIRERFHVQVRWEVFNVTNSPQYANPNVTVGTTLGTITSTVNSPRQQQFALRLSF